MHHFVSFLYPLIDRGHGPLFRWLMLMQMDRMDPGAVSFIGDAATFAEEGLPFGEECEVAGFVFQAPCRERYREYRKYRLTRDPFDRLLASSRGMLDAFRRMLTENIPEIRALIDTQLARIQEKNQRCVLMTWANCPSLRASAKARRIPVVHNELGPLRAPHFVPTVYFDFEGVNGATTAQRAAARHIDERKQLSLSSLAPRIADLYVADDSARAGGAEPEFDAAVALQVEDDSNVVAFSNGWSTAELMRFVVSRHGANRTLVRGHPGSAFRLASPAFGRVDDSPDSLTFLRRAKCLYTINSSVASEAAFFDRPFRVFGENPVAMLEEASASRSTRVRDARRAFYFLAYLVPARLAFDPEYYQWRLSRPVWEEIAERHLDVISDEARRMREETRPAVRGQPAPATVVTGEADSADWLAGRSLSVQLRAMRRQVDWLSHQHAAWERAALEHGQQLEQLRDAFDGVAARREELARECQRLDTLHRISSDEIARLKAALQESTSALDNASEARAWIEGERDKWHQAAQEAGVRYAELEGKLKDAAEAAQWLEQQRSAWEKEAQARSEAAARWQEQAHEEIARLKAALQESTSALDNASEARAWIEGERDKWHQAAQEAARGAEEQRIAWERKTGEQEANLASTQAEVRELVARLSAALRGLRQRRHEVAVLMTNPVVRAVIAIGQPRGPRPARRDDKASAR